MKKRLFVLVLVFLFMTTTYSQIQLAGTSWSVFDVTSSSKYVITFFDNNTVEARFMNGLYTLEGKKIKVKFDVVYIGEWYILNNKKEAVVVFDTGKNNVVARKAIVYRKKDDEIIEEFTDIKLFLKKYAGKFDYDNSQKTHKGFNNNIFIIPLELEYGRLISKQLKLVYNNKSYEDY